MENKLEEKPPFFKKWSGIYLFILTVEVLLIILFIWITNTFSA